MNKWILADAHAGRTLDGVKTLSVKDIEAGISALRNILAMPSMRRMNKSSVVGFLGELYVYLYLLQDGWEVEHAGNQSSVDLKATRGNKHVPIDVKTSTLKFDFNPLRNWGWTLISSTKNPKRLDVGTSIVCVALGQDYDLHRLYITSVANANQFPSSPKRQFKSAVNSLVLLEEFDQIPSLNNTHITALNEMEVLCSKYFKTAISPSELTDALVVP